MDLQFSMGTGLEFDFDFSGGGSGGGALPVATRFVTVYTTALTGTVGNLEEVDE